MIVILVDTSVWIDHLHAAESQLVAELESAEVAQHPMIIGELALGSLRARDVVIASLASLPAVTIASHAETMHFVETQRLWGTGLSLVDAHLLASVILTAGSRLWTRDAKLRRAAARCGVAFVER